MNKFERLLAKIAGKGDNKSLKADTVTESLLKDISNKIESGTLPEVTSDDNGSILIVADGAWSKVSENKIVEDVIAEIRNYGIVGVLPVPTDSDIGKSLKVNSEGEAEYLS